MRNDITEQFYPNKMNLNEFFESLFNEQDKNSFIQNMKNLKMEDEKYPEDWAQMFIAWKELNK